MGQSREGIDAYDARPAMDSQRKRELAKADAGRRVEFSSDTGNPTREMPHHRAGRQQMGRRQAEQSWTPYIVGFCMLCLGPMRPLLLELISTIYGEVGKLVWPLLGGSGSFGEEEEVAWYDQ